MTQLLELAKEVKELSQVLYGLFREGGNKPRMAHMKLIFDAAEQVRYQLEVDPAAFVSPTCWKALLAIQHIGFERIEPYEEYEKLVAPLYEKYDAMKSAYSKAFSL